MVRNTLRKARSAYRCENGCQIYKGDLYLEAVISPDHDGIGNTGWWTMKECFDCSTRHGRGNLFEDAS